MGRMTIKKSSKWKNKASYNQELNELKEWQDNQYNPGYYIGTGRVSYPLKGLSRRPKLKLMYMLYAFGPVAVALLFDMSWYKLLAIAFVVGAFALIIHDSKKHVG